MADQPVNPAPDAAAILLKIFEERMTDSVKTEEEMDYKAQQAGQKTHKITQFAMYSAFTPPVIFYLIGTLVLDMGVITDRMSVMAEDVA